MEARRSSKETGKTWRVVGGVLAAGALAVAGCSSSPERTEATTNPPPSAFSAEEVPKLIFDGLGGGSSIIEVYPGVTTSETDKIYNGTFNDGDKVAAECKTKGRFVPSHPEDGEIERTSDDWIRLATPGAEQYATAVYVENPDKLLAQLPNC